MTVRRFDRVAMIGLGYIGLPTAAVMASRGVSVLGIDISERVVETINRGNIHIVEPGLEELVKRVVAAGKLRALLVPRQDVGDPVLPEEGVVDGEVVNARDAEDVAHALGLERSHHPLAAGPAGHGGHRATVA